MPTLTPERPSGLLDTASVAALLGTTPRHVRDLRMKRVLPSVAVGRLVRFDPVDVRAFIAANRSPALRGPLAETVPARPARRRSSPGARS